MPNALPSPFERELRSTDQRRHWSASCQTYASADVLVEHLADGWDIGSVVVQEVSWRGGGRHITVYHFELTRGNRMLAMPVLDNPIVHRLMDQRRARTVLLEWMVSGSLRIQSSQRDPSSMRMLKAGIPPTSSVPRPIHAAMNKVKLVHSSEAQIELRRKNVTKKVRLFGPRSLDQATQYVQNHRGQSLILLKAPDRRIAVCGETTAVELKTKGFTPIDTE
jgi:hypothetical protein